MIFQGPRSGLALRKSCIRCVHQRLWTWLPKVKKRLLNENTRLGVPRLARVGWGVVDWLGWAGVW